MSRFAIEAYEQWPKVHDLVKFAAARNELHIDYGTWLSPIYVCFERPEVQAEYLTLFQENGVPYSRVG